MPTNLDRASLVARTVQIKSVNLASVAMKTHFVDEPPGGRIRLSQRFRAGNVPPGESGTILVPVDFRLEAVSGNEGEPDRPVFDLRATFIVTYRTSGSRTFPADAMTHFATLNGTHNAWPYWRELVQSMTMRAGMSGITVPVFRPKVREVEVQESLQIPDGEANVTASPTEQVPDPDRPTP